MYALESRALLVELKPTIKTYLKPKEEAWGESGAAWTIKMMEHALMTVAAASRS